MAAGLSILEHNIPAFQTAFEEAVREMVCEDDLSQTFITDGSLKACDITLEQAAYDAVNEALASVAVVDPEETYTVSPKSRPA